MCSTRESLPYIPGAARYLDHADKLASIGLYLELQNSSALLFYTVNASATC